MKVKFAGTGVVDGRGKLGGTVASRNKGGAFLRNKVTPLNPSTTAQALVRSVFAALSTMWKTLTEPQQDGWNALAAGTPYRDIFGDSRFINGNSFFVKSNTNRSTLGLTANGDAPVWVLPDGDVSFDITTFTASNIVIASPTATVPTGQGFVIAATPCVSPGRRNIENRYRIITVLQAGDDYDGIDLISEYVAAFGTPTATLRAGIRVFAIDRNVGSAGIAQSNQAIVS